MPELADVVIVGGGILGVSLAYELAKRTLRVTLLEAHALASGVTGSGFGWINATSKTDDEAYFKLNANAMTHYEKLATECGAEALGLKSGGTLYWARGGDAEGRERLRQRSARLQTLSYPNTMLDKGEMEVLEPHLAFAQGQEDAEGLFVPVDRWLDANRLARHLAQLARKHNADIREYTPVEAFQLDSLGAVALIRTADAEFATRTLVLTAGNQTPNLVAKLSANPMVQSCVALKHAPGLLIETAPLAGHGVHRVLYPPSSGGLHLRPTSLGGLLIGSDDMDQMLHLAPNSLLPPNAKQELLERVTTHLPSLALETNLAQAQAYACPRVLPADERPIVGALPGVKGAFVALTHSGATLGPYLARQLADEIMIRHIPEILLPYRPNRFLPTV